jgi:hypothetical protein
MCVYHLRHDRSRKEPPKRGELRLEAISYHSKESWVSLRVYKLGSKEWGGYDETELIYSRDKAFGYELGRIPLNPLLKSREERGGQRGLGDNNIAD